MRIKSQETIGELFIFSQVAIYGLYPVVINYSSKLMPPILFAGLSVLLASIFFFLVVAFQKNFHRIFKWESLKYILLVTLFIVVVPSIFIFTGTSMTSGVNTTILFQTEVVFTFLFVGIFSRSEKITTRRLIGAAIVLMGTATILYNGSFDLNLGDILIITGVAFYPFGNMAAKKALQLVPPAVILFVRSILGGLTLICFSFIFEDSSSLVLPSVQSYFPLIILNGIVIMFFSKILWYEGLKRIDLTKAVPIDMSFPAFSLLFLFLFTREVPTIYQWIGLILTLVGVGFVAYKSPPKFLERIIAVFVRKKDVIPPFE
jgi:drug/metabolite transporter (DMT)-like permease